jgi:alpha-mannosidase
VPTLPALGYLGLRRAKRDPRPPTQDGETVEAEAGGTRVRLDPGTGAIASLTSGGRELVKPGQWSGLNQLIYARGAPAELQIAHTEAATIRRERLPGVGMRLRATRRLQGLETLESTITLYDSLPWVDIENRFTKPETLAKEALYVAFPFAFTHPTAQIEVPLGRMTVERDQQPGSNRDWYCHTHWIWLTEGEAGVLWSAPDTPLVTFNDLFRGTWRTSLEPDGTLFALALHNYWSTNFPPRQGGSFQQRFRVSALAHGDVAEPVRRGWGACDPLWTSDPYDNPTPGPLLPKDRALFFADPGILLLAAKPADDGEGAVVRLLDITGVARPVSLWPAAYRYVQARRTNLLEMNEDSAPVAQDGRTSVSLPAWGVGSLRLFTPREGAS